MEIPEYEYVTWQDVKEAELGKTLPLDCSQESCCCKAIYGGVSFPGKRPGFAVVVAMNRFKRYGTQKHDVCLLEEFESDDMRELLWQCRALSFKWKPNMWIGDRANDAADRLIREMNRETEPPEDSQEESSRSFWLNSTSIMGIPNVYEYILSEIKHILNGERRQLELKESKIINYMSEIEQSDVAELELGVYPAIEALAFAVLEMRDRGHTHGLTLKQIEEWNKEFLY